MFLNENTKPKENLVENAPSDIKSLKIYINKNKDFLSAEDIFKISQKINDSDMVVYVNHILESRRLRIKLQEGRGHLIDFCVRSLNIDVNLVHAFITQFSKIFKYSDLRHILNKTQNSDKVDFVIKSFFDNKKMCYSMVEEFFRFISSSEYKGDILGGDIDESYFMQQQIMNKLVLFVFEKDSDFGKKINPSVFNNIIFLFRYMPRVAEEVFLNALENKNIISNLNREKYDWDNILILICCVGDMDYGDYLQLKNKTKDLIPLNEYKREDYYRIKEEKRNRLNPKYS